MAEARIGGMNEELDILRLVAERLEGAGIAYMLSGSMALAAYSQPRMTRDVDIVVELKPTDAPRIVDLFGGDFACDLEEIQEAIARERLFNLIHFEKVVKVDFIVRKSTPYRLEEFSRRKKLRVGETDIWVVSGEDLILSKLAWAKDSRSELQLRDVKGLTESLKDLDVPYLRRWASELGIESLLAQVLP